MMNSMAAIRCEGLSRTYGSVEAIKDLDLSIESGSVFGFLGRNGAGKTTTIRLLTGLAQPTRGRAWVNGLETTNRDLAAQHSFGYMPEVPAFYTWMTPNEYLNYVGQLFGIEPAALKKRSAELLEMCGLEKAANLRIGGFSKGMRQRLGLAQSLIHQPSVLFLDEPTSALDPAGRRDVLDLIAHLKGDTTIFLSSHILADVEERESLISRHATDVILLEFDRRNLDELAPFITRLESHSWVDTVSQDDLVLRVTVSDRTLGKTSLLKLVAESRLILSRYEWVRPSLEEVFLSISA